MRFPTFISSASNIPNWASRIKESSIIGKWQEVFSHYNSMKKAGIQPTEPSFFHPILKASLSLSHKHGESIHASIMKHGFGSFTSAQNSIMDFYIKAGVLGPALWVFNSISNRDSVSWNIMIHGHIDKGDFPKGLLLFMEARVKEFEFEPNISTLVLVVHACRSLRAAQDGMTIHGYVIQTGFWTITSVQNSLLGMYMDMGMELAWKVFDEMLDRDVVSWSVMIGGYVQSGEANVALGLFREMELEVGSWTDGKTMVSVLKACASLADVRVGRLVHGFVICKGLDCDVFVGNSLVDMYSKCRDVDSAYNVFGEIPEKNVVSWNSILSGLVYNEKHSEALMLVDSMGKAGFEADEVTLVNLLQICKNFVDPISCKLVHSKLIRRGYELNDFLVNSLIDTYAKCDAITLAWKLFSQTKEQDKVSWSTMISGFSHCGMPDQAIAVFREMNLAQEKPNSVTLLNLLEACSCSAELQKSKWAHGIVIRRGLASELALGTAILDMYSKCGAIEASKKAFNQISKKNIVSWSAMIAAYGFNGFGRDALALLSEMKLRGLKPNPVTMLSVLSACSHGGLVEEGLCLFKELLQDHEVDMKSEHYSCMVDLLGRAGNLDCAVALLERMPDETKPGASAWGALLSACRSYGKSDIGATAVSRVLELEPSNSSGYMLASSIYATDGAWVDAARMRWLLKDRRVKVVTGYSLVHVNNKTYRFTAGDKYHPLSDVIVLTTEQLHKCMRITMNKRNDELFLSC